MEKREFQTPLGEVWTWGEPEAFTSDRPLVLVIAGAFAAERGFFSMPRHLPGAAVLVAHQPGNHCPKLAATSVGAFGAAYASLIDQLARPVIVCGSSAGALVALALRSRRVRGQVLIDPPLRPAALPALEAVMRPIAASDADAAEYVARVFGYSADDSTPRDYSHLVSAIHCPTRVLVGAVQSGGELPSLVTPADRLLFARQQGATVTEVPGVGHNIPVEGGAYIVAALRGLLETASADQAPLARERAG